MKGLPKARTDQLLAEEVGDEIVVYDRLHQEAHCLSAESASVWRHCDGSRSPETLARELDLDSAIVVQALAELEQCDLLLGDGEPDRPSLSRRELTAKVAKYGGAALSAPLVYSVAIGPASAYASGQGNGTVCTADVQCASGHCVNGTCCNTPCLGACVTCASGTCFNLPNGTACGTGQMCNGSGTCV